ncbi:MAG TPA: AAA family ATPase [Sedimentisphaerales bacterium]|nr:AAA family ATPase [Sedimentisphaerales bacterium]
MAGSLLKSGVKIAIGGKGGVGKTTVCAVLAQLLAEDGFEVLAIDADPNTNLASALGVPAQESPEPLIGMKQLIAERTETDKEALGAYFRLNPKVSDLPEKYSVGAAGIKLLVLGGITQAGAGCACPEGAFLRALLTHTVLQRKEMVLVDLAAGVEFMGRASIQGVDLLVVVVEPGGRSIETAVNIARMARALGIKQVAAVLNKITDSGQVGTIESQLGRMPVLSIIRYSAAVQTADLQRRPVLEADPEIVNQLRLAKDALINLIDASAHVKAGQADLSESNG